MKQQFDGRAALLAMRAKREREREEIAAPYKLEAAHNRQVAIAAQRSLDELQRLMSGRLANLLFERMAAHMEHVITKQILAACNKAYPQRPDAIVTLELEWYALAWHDGQTLLRRVVEAWQNRTRQSIRFRAGDQISTHGARVLEARIPDFAYRETCFDGEAVR